VDGIGRDDRVVPLIDDHQEHAVEVRINGPISNVQTNVRSTAL
jgi:hypothetical protein